MGNNNSNEVRTDLLQSIMDMRSGAVAADLNEKFNEVLDSVIQFAGKGSLTITLNISPSKMGVGGAVLEVETKHECKLKKAEQDIGKCVFFVSQDGRLTRDDPAQTAMFDQQEAKGTRQ